MPEVKLPQVAMHCALIIAASIAAYTTSLAQRARIDTAEYSDQGELRFPADTASWIHLGSSLGGDYAAGKFDPENPGVIGVVQMEPTAFRYFREYSEYADGTMILLSFYAASSSTDPALQGFVQGDLLQQEIHVIDRSRFAGENRAFFVFRQGSESARALPAGSECFTCHSEHGAYDGTFAQFYPVIRSQIPAKSR